MHIHCDEHKNVVAYELTCDRCSKSLGGSAKIIHLFRMMENLGWTQMSNGKVICAKCQKAQKIDINVLSRKKRKKNNA